MELRGVSGGACILVRISYHEDGERAEHGTCSGHAHVIYGERVGVAQSESRQGNSSFFCHQKPERAYLTLVIN